jgi:hypothetical protein
MKSGDLLVRNYNLIQRYKGLPQAQPRTPELDTAQPQNDIVFCVPESGQIFARHDIDILQFRAEENN